MLPGRAPLNSLKQQDRCARKLRAGETMDGGEFTPEGGELT